MGDRLIVLTRNTTDVEEACIRGYNEGFKDGASSQKENQNSCDGCMGASFGDCDLCSPTDIPLHWLIDTPVLVRNSEKDPWILRYFYEFGKDGSIITYSGGTNSSNHYYNEMSVWKYGKLATYTLYPEIELIKGKMLRDFAHYCETKIPEYFYHVPASSSGKHHPSYALGDAGLLRHTKAAVKIAEDLLSLDQNSHLNHDTVIFALIFHDCVKQGMEESGSGHTEFLHPMLAYDFIKNCWSEYTEYSALEKKPMGSQLSDILSCIQSHMGQWNTSKHSEGKLLTPITENEKFVHMCDYLASRKYIEINFDSE